MVRGNPLGGLAFALVFFAMIYSYAFVSRLFHGDERPVSANGSSALAGLVFGIVLWPLHQLAKTVWHLPDVTWLAEALLLCGSSFELIRLHALLSMARGDRRESPPNS